MGKLVRLAKKIATGEILMKEGHDEQYEPLDLVCDTETCIVYFKFSERVYINLAKGTIISRAGYMSPYLGPNGRPCRLVDHKIVELD